MLGLEVSWHFKHLMMPTTYRQLADRVVPNIIELNQVSQKASLLKMSYIKDSKYFLLRWICRILGTTTRVEPETRETQSWCSLANFRYLLSNLRLIKCNHRMTSPQVQPITRLREWSGNKVLLKQVSKLVLNILLVDPRLIGLLVPTQGREVIVEQAGLEEM